MRTVYLVWADPDCGGQSPDWKEISGEDFYSLVTSLGDQERYFIKLHMISGLNEKGSDYNIVIECTKKQHVKWRREKNRADYLRKREQQAGYTILSFEELDNCDSLEAQEYDVEDTFMRQYESELIRSVLSMLDEDDHRLIDFLYFSETTGSERDYSALTGIPRKTINDRRNRIYKKLTQLF